MSRPSFAPAQPILLVLLAACGLGSGACVRRADPPAAPPPPPARASRQAPAQEHTVPASALKTQAPPKAPEAPRVDPVRAKVEAVLASLTLEQKIGQLMMVGFPGTTVDEDVRALVQGREVGGVCMFKRNIESAEQIARLNHEVRALLADRVPPFLALDQEGGNVVRIHDGNVVLPGNMALGATHSPQLAYQAGRAQAEDLLLLGFNMNLAPVLDVNLNPKNPVIGIRSFGDRPEVVARFGAQFVRGQEDANLITVAKHFPGHGSTEADSHRKLPVMTETRAELMTQLVPFTRAMEEGLDGLMTAHVALPKVTGHPHPATLSREILTGLLREDLGFDGLVLTDELEMDAIVDGYGVGRAAVMAVVAGADMVLVPWHPAKKVEVYDALLAAAREGEISGARLDRAVRRILRVKVKRGLFREPPPLEDRLARLGAPERLAVAKEIARRSVTLLRADPDQVPLRPGRKVTVITAEASLGEAILRRDPDAKVLVVPAWPSPEVRARSRQRARQAALHAEVVVVGLINSRQVDLVRMAAAAGKPVVVVSMGAPYLLSHLGDARAILAVYSYQESSAEAAAAALYGEAPTPGRLPVRLTDRLDFGFGLDVAGNLLGTETAMGSGAGAGK